MASYAVATTTNLISATIMNYLKVLSTVVIYSFLHVFTAVSWNFLRHFAKWIMAVGILSCSIMCFSWEQSLKEYLGKTVWREEHAYVESFKYNKFLTLKIIISVSSLALLQRIIHPIHIIPCRVHTWGIKWTMKRLYIKYQKYQKFPKKKN